MEKQSFENRIRLKTILLGLLFLSFLIINVNIALGVSHEPMVNYEKYHHSFSIKYENLFIEKTVYKPGDTIRGSFEILLDTNKTDRPVTEGSVEVLIYYITNEEEKSMNYKIYHNIARFFLENYTLTLVPGEKKYYEFVWRIPKNAPEGEYYIGLTTQMAGFDIGGHSEVQGLEGAKINFRVIKGNNKQYDTISSNSGLENTISFDLNNIKINSHKYNPATFIPEFERSDDITIEVPIKNKGKTKSLIIQQKLYLYTLEKQRRLEYLISKGIINKQNYPDLYNRIITTKSFSKEYKLIIKENSTRELRIDLGRLGEKLGPGFYDVELKLIPEEKDTINETLIIKIPIHGYSSIITFAVLKNFPIKGNEKEEIGIGVSNPTTTSALLTSNFGIEETETGMIEKVNTPFTHQGMIRINLISNNKPLFVDNIPMLITPMFNAVETGFLTQQKIKDAKLKVEVYNSKTKQVDDVELLSYNCEEFYSNKTKTKLFAFYNNKTKTIDITIINFDNYCNKKIPVSVLVEGDNGDMIYADYFVMEKKKIKIPLTQWQRREIAKLLVKVVTPFKTIEKTVVVNRYNNNKNLLLRFLRSNLIFYTLLILFILSLVILLYRRFYFKSERGGG